MQRLIDVEDAEGGIEPSVGRVSDFYDNALAEPLNGVYKAEVIHRQSWKNREAVELAALTWVYWFNHRRLLARSAMFRRPRPKWPIIANSPSPLWLRDSQP